MVRCWGHRARQEHRKAEEAPPGMRWNSSARRPGGSHRPFRYSKQRLQNGSTSGTARLHAWADIRITNAAHSQKRRCLCLAVQEQSVLLGIEELCCCRGRQEYAFGCAGNAADRWHCSRPHNSQWPHNHKSPLSKHVHLCAPGQPPAAVEVSIKKRSNTPKLQSLIWHQQYSIAGPPSPSTY